MRRYDHRPGDAEQTFPEEAFRRMRRRVQEQLDREIFSILGTASAYDGPVPEFRTDGWQPGTPPCEPLSLLRRAAGVMRGPGAPTVRALLRCRTLLARQAGAPGT